MHLVTDEIKVITDMIFNTHLTIFYFYFFVCVNVQNDNRTTLSKWNTWWGLVMLMQHNTDSNSVSSNPVFHCEHSQIAFKYRIMKSTCSLACQQYAFFYLHTACMLSKIFTLTGFDGEKISGNRMWNLLKGFIFYFFKFGIDPNRSCNHLIDPNKNARRSCSFDS